MIKTNIFVLVIDLQEVFKTSSRHFQNILQEVIKTSSRCIVKLKCVFQNVFRKPSRRIQHAFDTYWKSDYLENDLPRPHVWEIYGQCTNFPTMNSLDMPKFLEQIFKALYEVTASTNKDILVEVGYQKRCCCLNE